MPFNIEIKARTQRTEAIRTTLKEWNADFRGVDHQVDTYFHCQSGRMKLRQGNIEHTLIHYERSDQAGPKASIVHLYHPQPGPELKDLLTQALGIWKEVKKAREIFFVENVKVHLDTVEGLGTFVEIEAIDTDGSISQETLQSQCEQFMKAFKIQEKDLLEMSYSDMVGGK